MTHVGKKWALIIHIVVLVGCGADSPLQPPPDASACAQDAQAAPDARSGPEVPPAVPGPGECVFGPGDRPSLWACTWAPGGRLTALCFGHTQGDTVARKVDGCSFAGYFCLPDNECPRRPDGGP